jgi:hypothetical protein
MRRFSVFVVFLLACGFSLINASCEGSGESTAVQTTESTGTTSHASIPPELIGTWKTKLSAADIPAGAPPELQDAATDWELQIAETGGTDNAPVLSIVNPELGQLEGPTLQVAGDHLRLLQEECAAGGDTQFFDNEYSFTLEGDTLTIATVTNQCADHVAETILTSEPWTKSAAD